MGVISVTIVTYSMLYKLLISIRVLVYVHMHNNQPGAMPSSLDCKHYQQLPTPAELPHAGFRDFLREMVSTEMYGRWCRKAEMPSGLPHPLIKLPMASGTFAAVGLLLTGTK